MKLELQRYNITVIYKPGKEMYLADTLSRAYLKKNYFNNDKEER